MTEIALYLRCPFTDFFGFAGQFFIASLIDSVIVSPCKENLITEDSARIFQKLIETVCFFKSDFRMTCVIDHDLLITKIHCKLLFPEKVERFSLWVPCELYQIF